MPMAVIAHALITVPSATFRAANKVAVPLRLSIVGHGAATAFLQRQSGLCTIQRLNLALLVYAHHDGMFGWIQIEADDGFQFLRKLLVLTKLENSL
jgi:hypothetical protein